MKIEIPARVGGSLLDMMEALHRTFATIIAEMRRNNADTDLGRIIVEVPSSERPVIVSLRKLSLLTAQDVIDNMEKMLQSNRDFVLDRFIRVTTGIIHIQKVGSNRASLKNLPNSAKRSCVTIPCNDKMCLARAITVCWCHSVKCTTKEYNHKSQGIAGGSIANKCFDVGCVPDHFYKTVTNPQRNEQGLLAKKLCTLSGVGTDTLPLPLTSIRKFEDFLSCNIYVIDESDGNKIMQKSRIIPNKKNLFISVSGADSLTGHYHATAVTRISGFLQNSSFCESCVCFHGKDYCKRKCYACGYDDCKSGDTVKEFRKCDYCFMSFWNVTCFANHMKPSKTKSKSMCDMYWFCTKCKKKLDRRKRPCEVHVCGEIHCNICNIYHVDSDNHTCYQKIASCPRPVHKYLFYDYETRSDSRYECEEGFKDSGTGKCENCSDVNCGRYRHTSNFCVVQSTCETCCHEDVTRTSKCHTCGDRCHSCSAYLVSKHCFKKPTYCDNDKCGLRQVCFKGSTCGEDFGDWVFQRCHDGFTMFAHNSRAFDIHLLMEYMISKNIKPSRTLYNGSKIVYMQIHGAVNIRCMDSLNFIPLPLSAFPKAFGFEDSKGYFPHKFNTKENENYCGPMPGIEFYDIDQMRSNARAAVMEWYDENKDKEFDMSTEIYKYCEMDVSILRKACLKFHTLIRDLCNVECFRSVTMAGLCMLVFRSQFATETWEVKLCDSDVMLPARKRGQDNLEILSEGKWVDIDESGLSLEKAKFVESPIVLTTANGIQGNNVNHSKDSIEWLEYMSHKLGWRIIHARNGGEHKLPGSKYFVDGYCENMSTCFEYHSCELHGHKCVKGDRSRKLYHGRSLNDLFSATEKKREYIEKKMKMNYICMWSCEWNVMRKKRDVYDYVCALDIQERLCARDALYGGRTGGCKLYHKVSNDKEIRYSDFTSLYPAVMKYDAYMYGAPEIINTCDNINLSDCFGILKVKVSPPRGLYLPVLPYRCNGKLVFGLCAKCMENMTSDTPCTCTASEREWIGTYTSMELSKAVDKGYKIVKIYEVYNWKKKSVYEKNCQTKFTNGLFTDYIDLFLKVKQESSGLPAWVKDDVDLNKYVSEYLCNEGILLDKAKIEKNAPLRYTSKIFLNSLWGKFCENPKKRKNVIVTSKETYKVTEALSDPSKLVTNFHILSPDMMVMESEDRWDSYIPATQSRNVYIGVFVTSHARLRLYNVMEEIGGSRILYYDTDSIIYVCKKGEKGPYHGDYLGQLTNELDNDDFIEEFVTTGPKSYAFRTKNGKEVCKCKGISMNYSTEQIVNMNEMLKIVKEDRKRVVTVNCKNKIIRDKCKSILLNRVEKKNYRMVFTKRVVGRDYDTLPYGF